MDTNTARIVLIAITAVGAVIWLVGFCFLLMSRRARYPASGHQDRETLDDKQGGWLAGAADVEGESDELSARAARLLAQGNIGPVKVLERTKDRIRFERASGGMTNAPGQWFQRGELRFLRLRTGGARVSWLVEPSPTNWLLWLGALFQLLGLVALVVGCWAVYAYLVTSNEPAMRWQTLQMLQAYHFLWPPFLFGGLYRAGTRSVTGQFEALAHNLPFLEGAQVH